MVCLAVRIGLEIKAIGFVVGRDGVGRCSSVPGVHRELCGKRMIARRLLVRACVADVSASVREMSTWSGFDVRASWRKANESSTDFWGPKAAGGSVVGIETSAGTAGSTKASAWLANEGTGSSGCAGPKGIAEDGRGLTPEGVSYRVRRQRRWRRWRDVPLRRARVKPLRRWYLYRRGTD